MVAGREVKGFVVPQWAAAVLLGTLLSALGGLYLQNQSQREIMIRLDQKLSDKMAYDDKEFVKIDNRFSSVEAWQDVTNKSLVKIGDDLEDMTHGSRPPAQSVQRRSSSQ